MAQTQIYTGKSQIYLIEETSQDTVLVPAGAGAGIIIGEVDDAAMTVNSENFIPAYHRADFLSMEEVVGSVSASISFRCPLRGSGTAGTAPEFSEALKACGFEATTASVTDTYTPISVFDGAGGNPGPSYTVAILNDGLRYAIKGAFGNVSFSCPVGEPGYMSFEFQGAYVAVADDATEAPTYNTTVPPAFLGASITIGGATPKGIESFELDMGNVIRLGPDANEATGFYGARITGRKSSGSVDVEAVIVATRDDFALWRAGTVAAITTGQVGGTAGNSWTLTAARCSRRAPTMSNADGVRKYDIPFGVGSVATDVEATNYDITLLFD